MKTTLFQRLGAWLISKAVHYPYAHISDYMARYWLVPYRDELAFPGPWPRLGRLLGVFGIAARIHHIKRSDDDRAFHDHPMNFVSIILRGRYIEVTPIYDEHGMYQGERRQMYTAGCVLRRKAKDWHRLELIPGETVWTLFITGKWRQRWGFLNKPGHKTYYQDYPAAEPVMRPGAAPLDDAGKLPDDALNRLNKINSSMMNVASLTGTAEFCKRMAATAAMQSVPAHPSECVNDSAGKLTDVAAELLYPPRVLIVEASSVSTREKLQAVMDATRVQNLLDAGKTVSRAAIQWYAAACVSCSKPVPLVIGLIGDRGVGKDTLADYLVRRHGFVKMAFADALREEVLQAFPQASEYLLNNPQTKEEPTARLSLSRCTDKEFVHAMMFTDADNAGEQSAYDYFDRPRSARQILQRWGTEYRRKQDPEYWIRRMSDRMMKHMIDSPLAAQGAVAHPIVITDIRFENEMDLVAGVPGRQIVRVIRNTTPARDHASDHLPDTPPDSAAIINNGRLEALYVQADRLVRRWRG